MFFASDLCLTRAKIDYFGVKIEPSQFQNFPSLFTQIKNFDVKNAEKYMYFPFSSSRGGMC